MPKGKSGPQETSHQENAENFHEYHPLVKVGEHVVGHALDHVVDHIKKVMPPKPGDPFSHLPGRYLSHTVKLPYRAAHFIMNHIHYFDKENPTKWAIGDLLVEAGAKKLLQVTTGSWAMPIEAALLIGELSKPLVEDVKQHSNDLLRMQRELEEKLPPHLAIHLEFEDRAVEFRAAATPFDLLGKASDEVNKAKYWLIEQLVECDWEQVFQVGMRSKMPWQYAGMFFEMPTDGNYNDDRLVPIYSVNNSQDNYPKQIQIPIRPSKQNMDLNANQSLNFANKELNNNSHKKSSQLRTQTVAIPPIKFNNETKLLRNFKDLKIYGDSAAGITLAFSMSNPVGLGLAAIGAFGWLAYRHSKKIEIKQHGKLMSRVENANSEIEVAYKALGENLQNVMKHQNSVQRVRELEAVGNQGRSLVNHIDGKLESLKEKRKDGLDKEVYRDAKGHWKDIRNIINVDLDSIEILGMNRTDLLTQISQERNLERLELLKSEFSDKSCLEAAAAFDKKEFKLAGDIIENGLQQRPDHPGLNLIRGNLYLETQPQQALSDFQKVLNVDNNNYPAMVGKICAEANQDKYEEAFLSLGALKKNRFSEESQQNIDQFEFQLKEKLFNDCISRIEQGRGESAIKLIDNPNFKLAPEKIGLLKGYYAYKYSDWLEAIEHLQASNSVEGNNSKVAELLVQCHFQLQDYDNTIKYLKEAIQLDPDRKDLNRFLGVVYEMSGDDTAAAAHYADLLKENPQNLEIVEAQKNVMKRINKAKNEMIISVASAAVKTTLFGLEMLEYSHRSKLRAKLKEIPTYSPTPRLPGGKATFDQKQFNVTPVGEKIDQPVSTQTDQKITAQTIAQGNKYKTFFSVKNTRSIEDQEQSKANRPEPLAKESNRKYKSFLDCEVKQASSSTSSTYRR